MSSVQDKVAIVTGGGRGIGGATARRLAKEGAKVLIAEADAAAAEENAERIKQAGGIAIGAPYDVANQDDVRRMVEHAVSEWGRLDIVVNNAYGRKEPDGSALTLSDTELDYALTIMVKTLVWSARYAVPHIQKAGGGSIVNISSVHGLLMAPNTFAYEAGRSAQPNKWRLTLGQWASASMPSAPATLSPSVCSVTGTKTPQPLPCSRRNIPCAAPARPTTSPTPSTSSARMKPHSSRVMRWWLMAA
jgi:hypothetical protein